MSRGSGHCHQPCVAQDSMASLLGVFRNSSACRNQRLWGTQRLETAKGQQHSDVEECQGLETAASTNRIGTCDSPPADARCFDPGRRTLLLAVVVTSPSKSLARSALASATRRLD